MVILYTLVTLIVGWVIIRELFSGLPPLLSVVGAFLIGTAVVVPITYLLSYLFRSILWGTIATLSLGLVGLRTKLKFGKISVYEAAFLFIALAFSTWMMFKTFHGGAGGQLFVGSNNVFDFGLAVGLMRSMSWGTNIPFMSPFFAGLPLFYHYFFSFWTALWENFGVPAVWAINVPSILSFSALLVVIYYFPQIIAKQKPIIGWIAVLLTITNSSLTFWKILQSHTNIWHLPTYPFAGPFDGSTISIFITLNNYVNQRHLAFAIALGLFIYIAATKHCKSWFLGVLTGFLLLWNMVVYGIVVILCGMLFLIQKRWKSVVLYVVISALVGFMWLIPYLNLVPKIFTFLHTLRVSGIANQIHWSLNDYLWQNLGLLPIVAVFGFFVIQKRNKLIFLPFMLFFAALCIFAGVGGRGFEQKTFSFFIIGINVLAAIGLGWIWKNMKILAIVLVFVLTISGFVDLIPIKNEFAFPLVGSDTAPVISWIHNNTPGNAVFVSYADIIDPVVLAGRKNYFGFFGNIGWYDRTSDVARIYGGDKTFAKIKNISYILVPKWKKADFVYPVHLNLMRVLYEDAKYRVYAVE